MAGFPAACMAQRGSRQWQWMALERSSEWTGWLERLSGGEVSQLSASQSHCERIYDPGRTKHFTGDRRSSNMLWWDEERGSNRPVQHKSSLIAPPVKNIHLLD